jgi:hypothetical protein
MRHVKGISSNRLPAPAPPAVPLSDSFIVCFQYLLNSGDFKGFADCVNCKFDPNCPDI